MFLGGASIGFDGDGDGDGMMMLTGSLQGLGADVYGVLIKSWTSAVSSTDESLTGIYLGSFHAAVREVALLLPDLPVIMYGVLRVEDSTPYQELYGRMVLQILYRYMYYSVSLYD
jgi:hypothetical protein